jgi:hypothetical protein
MNQQVVVKPAQGRQREQTLRLIIDGRPVDLDLTHKPNRDLAEALGYVVFPVVAAIGHGQ